MGGGAAVGGVWIGREGEGGGGGGVCQGYEKML